LEPKAQEVSQATQKDLSYDKGWEDGQKALREHWKSEENEARMQGFQEGFKAGFKEGREVGMNEPDHTVFFDSKSLFPHES
jgi:flagellar biosynthesis/type III secretory pathway protein FliH